MKKILCISAFATFLILFSVFYFSKSPTPEQTLKPAPEQIPKPVPEQITHQKCPEDYTEDATGTAEYRNALIDWTNGFFETHPNATMSDWSMARIQLLVDNNCVTAIGRSKLFGKVVDLKPWELVNYEVQNAIQNAINKIWKTKIS